MTNSNPAPHRGRGTVIVSLSWLLAGIFFLCGCRSSIQTTETPAFQRKYGDFAYCPVPVAEQTTRHSCGPACLASILTYWDANLSETRILETYPTPERRPYYLVELRAIAEAEGRKAYILSMDTQPRQEAEQQILKEGPLRRRRRTQRRAGPPHGPGPRLRDPPVAPLRTGLVPHEARLSPRLQLTTPKTPPIGRRPPPSARGPAKPVGGANGVGS